MHLLVPNIKLMILTFIRRRRADVVLSWCHSAKGKNGEEPWIDTGLTSSRNLTHPEFYLRLTKYALS